MCSENFIAVWALGESHCSLERKSTDQAFSQVLFSTFPSLSAETAPLAALQLLPRVSACACALGLLFVVQGEVLNNAT